MMDIRPGIIPLVVFVAFTALVIGHGCGTSNPTYNDEDPAFGNIELSIREVAPGQTGTETTTVMLFMSDGEQHPCFNWGIRNEISRDGDEIMVDLRGIDVPEICLTAIGPATATAMIELGEGIYTLIFGSGTARDYFNLVVTDSTIELRTVEANFVTPQNYLFWRYPERSFVYTCGTTTETSWMCDAFAATLLSNLELEEFTFPDSGEICYPRTSYGHYYDAPARYFYYQHKDDFDRAGELLRSFTQNSIGDQQGIGLHLINWKDEHYRSWQMGN
jgi:hypothetical protein